MSYDMNVVNTAYQTAKKLGASNKIILALFEAGIVESGFRNLPYGDATSLGFLQQKPEYWGGRESVMNVATATTSFVNVAKKLENKYKSPGNLAQAVQKSALPWRYNEEEAAAKALLKKVSGENFTPEEKTSVIDFATNPVESINQLLLSMVKNLLPFISKLTIYIILLIIIFISLQMVYEIPTKKIIKGVTF